MKTLKRKFSRMSFRTRIRIGIVAVILLITALSISVSIYREEQHQIQALNELGEYISLSLGQNSVLGILSEEKVNLEQALKAALSDEQVLAAHVYSISAELIGDMHRKEYTLKDFKIKDHLRSAISAEDHAIILETKTDTGEEVRSYLSKVTVSKASDDIFSDDIVKGQLCGFVRVDLSLGLLFERRVTAIWQNLMFIPVYLLVGILSSIAIERRISLPLIELKSVATAVAQGDFSRKTHFEAEDEIGLLSRTFNDMSHNLSEVMEKLNRSNEDLEKVNKELQDFTYVVSHDLQEPLRKVHSFGQFLLEDCYERLTDDGRDYINRMQNASVKMKTLIQDLLKLSRIGTVEAEFTKVDLNNVVASAIDDLAIAIKESGAEVKVGELPDVVGQNTMLTQLFENIIGNAIKYKRQDAKPRVEISASPKQNGYVTFLIKDNGIGIKDKYREKIFGVFQRLHTNEYKGTGIGLALCKKIVDRHGGRIWAESNPDDSGTIFSFTLKKYKG